MDTIVVTEEEKLTSCILNRSQVGRSMNISMLLGLLWQDYEWKQRDPQNDDKSKKACHRR